MNISDEAKTALLLAALNGPGALGPQGPAGPAGPTGATGPAGAAGGSVFPTTEQRWVNAIDGDDSATGTIGEPFATLQHAIDDIGAPTSQGEFERVCIIHCIGYGALGNGVFTTRRWHLMIDPGIVVGDCQMQEVEADRFSSTFPASLNFSCQGRPSASTGTADGGATVGDISVVHAGSHAAMDVHVALTNVNRGGITLDSGVTALLEQHGGVGRSVTGNAAVFFADDGCRLGAVGGGDHLTCLAIAAIRDSAIYYGTVTVTAASPAEAYRAISRSLFVTSGVTFTGPALSLVVDRATYATFVAASGILGGSATAVFVDPIIIPMSFGLNVPLGIGASANENIPEGFSVGVQGTFANADYLCTRRVRFTARRVRTFELTSGATQQLDLVGNTTASESFVDAGAGGNTHTLTGTATVECSVGTLFNVQVSRTAGSGSLNLIIVGVDMEILP